MVKLKLNLFCSASRELIEALDLFEEREKKVHKIHDKMEEILTLRIKKHHV